MYRDHFFTGRTWTTESVTTEFWIRTHCSLLLLFFSAQSKLCMTIGLRGKTNCVSPNRRSSLTWTSRRAAGEWESDHMTVWGLTDTFQFNCWFIARWRGDYGGKKQLWFPANYVEEVPSSPTRELDEVVGESQTSVWCLCKAWLHFG